jgi:hypothetical protein
MQIPFVDNGFAVITKDNADSFVLEHLHGGRWPQLPRRPLRGGPATRHEHDFDDRHPLFSNSPT